MRFRTNMPVVLTRVKYLTVCILRYISLLLAIPILLACHNRCALGIGIWLYAIFIPLHLVPMLFSHRTCFQHSWLHVIHILGLALTTIIGLLILINSLVLMVTCILFDKCTIASTLILFKPVYTDVQCSLSILFGLFGSVGLQMLVNVLYFYIYYSPVFFVLGIPHGNEDA